MDDKTTRFETGVTMRDARPQLEGLLKPTEVAVLLGVPVSTVHRWRSTGYGPPGLRIGKHLRFRADDIRRWLETQRTEAPQQVTQREGPAATAPERNSALNVAPQPPDEGDGPL